MFKKLFRRISLGVWVLQQKFKKEEKKIFGVMSGIWKVPYTYLG